MRRSADLLFCAAGALWLATVGFVQPSGQASADEVPRKNAREAVQNLAQEALRKMGMAHQEALRKNAQEAAMAQQFEQHFAPQFRQLYRTELHFMRLVCQPTKQQYEKIAADGEAALKTTLRNVALKARVLNEGRPAALEQFDPRMSIADALAGSVRATLSSEQAARYQTELDQRAVTRKRVVLLNLVAKVDKVLILTTEQRDKLGAILEDNWKDSWNQTVFMHGGHLFPRMPDMDIRLILTETQKNVWSGIQKNVQFGWDLGIVPGLEIGEEVWDDDPPQENPERAKGKAAVKGQRTTKPVERK